MTALRKPSAPDGIVLEAAQRVARAIPPLWPLAATVAVNPFLGQSREDLATTDARLQRVAGCRGVMDRTWYKARVDRGEISDADLMAALSAAPTASRPSDLATLKAALDVPCPVKGALPTVAELAARASGFDWPDLVAERIGTWAASYFDDGQALWPAPVRGGAWRTWRDFALRDLCPEIAGLKGFAARAAEAPLSTEDALEQAARRLHLSPPSMETYFHRLLVTLGGWAQIARQRMWQAELADATDPDLMGLLAIRLQWEAALLDVFEDDIADGWHAVVAAHEQPVTARPEHVLDGILQEAAERAAQRKLFATMAAPSTAPRAERPALHAVFCIDVRSEVFRRALESVAPDIRTSGFAGFFGLAVAHRDHGSDVREARCPVLLKPGDTSGVLSKAQDGQDPAVGVRIAARAKRAWGRFKMAAVSSFAFVEAAGPLYAPRLVRDAMAIARPVSGGGGRPVFDPPLSTAQRIDKAETVLRAMSLTGDFARLVIFTGHAARVVNNPHASALQCGACGGYAGDVNARLLAGLLNDPDVRAGLAQRGLVIPDETLFLGALHDTTSDDVTIYADDTNAAAHREDIRRATAWFAQAGRLARSERAMRLPRANHLKGLEYRGRDWSEVRPEWGLAGCQAFIAAPRARTAGRHLSGRAFLHDYDWRADDGFGVLELILTAPVVVASWISLQYYGSTVAPDVFGAGNKLLHNVSGGIGVFEGNVGILRTGLPRQSVHDGHNYAHEPLRLTVMVEAPREAIGRVLEIHPDVRTLFDNRWMHLFAMDDDGRPAFRYVPGGGWERMANADADGGQSDPQAA